MCHMGQNTRLAATRWQLVQWGTEAEQFELDRASHSATVVGDKIYLFGGRRGSRFFDDLLVFNTTTGVWSKPARPCPFGSRANHTGTLIGNCIWFVGGMDREDVLGDVFYCDLATHTWHKALLL